MSVEHVYIDMIEGQAEKPPLRLATETKEEAPKVTEREEMKIVDDLTMD